MLIFKILLYIFFFNDTATTEIYTLSLHDALPIYVSRANGAGLHRVVRKGKWPALSRDGRLLAFTKETGIWIVGTNGRGLRRLTSGRYDQASDWSPNGKA